MRKSRRNEWFEIAVHPSEISAGPVEIIAKIAEEGQQAEHQCQELFRVLTEAEQLKQRLDILERDCGAAHHGKPFSDVGAKQKKRHLKQIG